LANCLAFSKNTASVRMTNLLGVDRIIEFAKTAGITAKLPPYTSLALGAAEIPLLQMLQAYTMFANKGFSTEPVFISRIEDKDGNVLEEFTQINSKQVISEQDAFTMVKLMQGVVQIGTGKSLNKYDIPAQKAGKTGTTNDNADGWFMGYTPELLAGTWVGCDDPFIRIYAGTTGGNEMALPKWGYFMNKVYEDKTLPYRKTLNFEGPSQMTSDPIYADQNFKDIINSGDSSNYSEDRGNGAAEDFIVDPVNNNNTSKIPIESEFDNNKKDTDTKVKNKAEPAQTPKQTDPKAVMPTPIKSTDDKNKKTVNQEKAKTSKSNDY
jgi:penicillin-binding protein 1A